MTPTIDRSAKKAKGSNPFAPESLMNIENQKYNPSVLQKSKLHQRSSQRIRRTGRFEKLQTKSEECQSTASTASSRQQQT